jgi:hypothetical protein
VSTNRTPCGLLTLWTLELERGGEWDGDREERDGDREGRDDETDKYGRNGKVDSISCYPKTLLLFLITATILNYDYYSKLHIFLKLIMICLNVNLNGENIAH